MTLTANEHSQQFSQFHQQLRSVLPAKAIIDKLSLRYAYGTDASFYRLVPKLIVEIDNETQLQHLLRLANEYCIAVTFRAAGTSLSGQAITDSVLVMLSDNWQAIDVLNDGLQVNVQPGVIGAKVNQVLLPYGRKIGPDPASINTCKIGGIAANNASGMCCGVSGNSYHTLAGMRLLLANGSLLDSDDEYTKTVFYRDNAQLLQTLSDLRNQLLANVELQAKVRHKYRLKNTTGYGLNALLDFDDPLDILMHLMIGSEGTLGFIADMRYHTLVDEPYKATGLFVFDNTHRTCELVSQLAALPVEAVEIMDYRALMSVQLQAGMPSFETLTEHSAALLVEVVADSDEALHSRLDKVQSCLDEFTDNLVAQQSFSQETNVRQNLWNIRKGMFPAVGANRPIGTTVIIEDVAFPVDNLASGMAALQALLIEYNYLEAIIFGHALSGNLHFVFTQSFAEQSDVDNYDAFMQQVTQLVAVEYHGSLKAEHGTGRNMAPFVALEWGDEAYDLMCHLKALFDPNNILNPGVIINDDANAHIQHLKTLPATDSNVDPCIECGFCEPVCPSKALTLTPRQRISLWRRIVELDNKQDKSPVELKALTEFKQDYQYFGIDSCAATGLCAQRCPVNIDTGELIKSLRAKQQKQQSQSNLVANHFESVNRVARFGLKALNVSSKLLGKDVTQRSANLLGRVIKSSIPKDIVDVPKPAKPIRTGVFGTQNEQVVYIPSCPNRLFAPDAKAADQRPLPNVVISLLNKAGFGVIIPSEFSSHCCGMPWTSKGFPSQAKTKKSELVSLLNRYSRNGELSIVFDASPCGLTLSDVAQLRIFEVTDFVATYCLERLDIKKTTAPIMLHVTCSTEKMGQSTSLMALASSCSSSVIVPDDIHCCGFAGDKGFSFPELNASALASLKAQVPANCVQGVSNSRTCEIGLSKHSGISYQSVLYLLDKQSDSKFFREH